MDDLNLWILNVEDGISGVNLGDEVSLQEVTILDVVLTVGDIECYISCTQFLELDCRELESTAGGADVIHNENPLSSQVCVRDNIQAKNLTGLPLSLLDTKGNRQTRFLH